MSGREHLIAVSAVDKGRVMELLRYAPEIRPAKAYFDDLPDLKLDKEMVTLASELIAKKAAPFTPERYKDSYAEAVKAMIEEKAKGHRISARPEIEAPQGNVIDLMVALRKSLKDAAPTARKAEPAKEPASESKKKPVRKRGRV